MVSSSCHTAWLLANTDAKAADVKVSSVQDANAVCWPDQLTQNTDIIATMLVLLRNEAGSLSHIVPTSTATSIMALQQNAPPRTHSQGTSPSSHDHQVLPKTWNFETTPQAMTSIVTA